MHLLGIDVSKFGGELSRINITLAWLSLWIGGMMTSVSSLGAEMALPTLAKNDRGQYVFGPDQEAIRGLSYVSNLGGVRLSVEFFIKKHKALLQSFDILAIHQGEAASCLGGRLKSCG
jgi:hypothetical protein